MQKSWKYVCYDPFRCSCSCCSIQLWTCSPSLERILRSQFYAPIPCQLHSPEYTKPQRCHLETIRLRVWGNQSILRSRYPGAGLRPEIPTHFGFRTLRCPHNLFFLPSPYVKYFTEVNNPWFLARRPSGHETFSTDRNTLTLKFWQDHLRSPMGCTTQAQHCDSNLLA
ncbi:hypothetical protein K469DRAFT_304192 [Zopfia rhizophila CBS 207.26]|uniref:Uncharacterized protein n=1 Tax=Zopfia rhizophila CBS 207.26 TaxID=1314779 RepID=A0A6A6DIA8_9PEZI|nr:hypothetical protein K469DRAFT_304192 [Zopfia rhizophila CBS 207.26]